MNVIVCGSRTFDDYNLLTATLSRLAKGFRNLVMYVGDAKGVDSLACRWAYVHGITYKVFHADWNKHGRAAGPKRNAEMVEAAGPKARVIAFWDGESRGTKNTLDLAKAKGLKTKIIFF